MRSARISFLCVAGLILNFFVLTNAVPTASALPTPGVNCQVAAQANNPALRFFPEAEQTNDYIGYFEAKTCFDALNRTYPDRVEVKYIGKSYGWVNKVTQQREPNDIPLVEVTNEKSPIPFEDKVKIVLMLSIHGNEKGGREGGFRVLEDYVRNLGMARTEATGHSGKTLYELMDYAVFVLLFPNPDGWTKDEPQYYQPNPNDPTSSTFYTRGNGRGTDLNRQLPTAGWTLNPSSPTSTRKTLNEPEPQAYAPFLKNYTNVAYAADIHGMLNPADGCVYGVCAFTQNAAPTGENVYGHFVLGLISAGQLTPFEMLRSTRLANLLTSRLNNDPTFAAWYSTPSASVWGGEFYQWSTVWDTIGYTDSGISGDWFLQDTGLNAPGMDFEMAYNHITFDSAYPAVAQLMNAWHVQTVRHIARAYLEAAVTDVQTSIETHGKTSGYLYNPKVFSSATDKPLEGWALENPHDDRWDYAHVPYEAAPADYFRELAPFVIDGDKPGVLDEVPVASLTKETLARYDNFIIAGSAVDLVLGNSALQTTLKEYVEGGGNLILTDEAMKLLGSPLGVVDDGSVKVLNKYAGMTLMTDRAHPFAEHSVKLSRQTYEPVPIGYSLQGVAPNWVVDQAAFKAKGGEMVGVVPVQGNGAGTPGTGLPPPVGPSGGIVGDVNLGRIKVGEGTVSFLGSLLPDPSQEYYHPYGLESYATTYFGNLLLYNMMGAEQVFTEPPIILENVGSLRNQTGPGATNRGTVAASPSEDKGTPGLGAAAIVAALAAAIVLARRRRPE